MIVIGVGNELRRDDGAGPAVIEELRGRSLEGVTLAVSDGEPSRLIDLWAGADQAVVIDAAPTSSGEPGHVRELDSVDGVPSSTSSHALGLGVASRLGRTLDRMPATMRIFIIEGADFGFGAGLCPPVARAVTDVADRIARLSRDAHS
jgi:hydrogenase maturation protease